jgi:hypothetical protein
MKQLSSLLIKNFLHYRFHTLDNARLTRPLLIDSDRYQ